MTDKTDEQKKEEAGAEKANRKVKVRVIRDHDVHVINDVLELSPDAARAAVDGGWADDHPSAVAYALGPKR